MNLHDMLLARATAPGGSGGTPGGGAQPDWNATEGEAGHVLNRTHFEESVAEEVNITFDGDITGKEVVILNEEDGFYLVKVSEAVPTVEALRDGTVKATMLDGASGEMQEQVFSLAEGIASGTVMIQRATEQVVFVVTNGMPIIAVASEAGELEGISFNRGTNFLCVPGYMYVSALSCVAETTRIHHLDPKYIKDMYYEKAEEVNITWDGDATDKEIASNAFGMKMVKVSTIMPTIEELKRATFSLYALDNGVTEASTYTMEEFAAMQNKSVDEIVVAAEGVPLVFAGGNGGGGVVVVAYAAFSEGDVSYTPGTYFFYQNINEAGHVGEMYVTSLTYSNTEIHKIPSKYIDAEWMATETTIEVEVVPQTTLNGGILPDCELEEGQTYVVYWNGARYECVCETIADIYQAIGNLASYGSVGNPAAPFVIVRVASMNLVQAQNVDGSNSNGTTVSIAKWGVGPVKLPEKFLPKLYATVEQLEALDNSKVDVPEKATLDSVILVTNVDRDGKPTAWGTRSLRTPHFINQSTDVPIDGDPVTFEGVSSLYNEDYMLTPVAYYNGKLGDYSDNLVTVALTLSAYGYKNGKSYKVYSGVFLDDLTGTHIVIDLKLTDTNSTIQARTAKWF